MRLSTIGEAFVAGRPIRGCGLVVSYDEDATILSYASGRRIATITERTATGHRLTLHRPYTYASHSNRLKAVLAVYTPETQEWGYRYSAYIRWGGMQIFDRKLGVEIQLNDDLEFVAEGNNLRFEYEAYERQKLAPKEKVSFDPPENDLIKQLTAIVADI